MCGDKISVSPELPSCSSWTEAFTPEPGFYLESKMNELSVRSFLVLTVCILIFAIILHKSVLKQLKTNYIEYLMDHVSSSF